MTQIPNIFYSFAPKEGKRHFRMFSALNEDVDKRKIAQGHLLCYRISILEEGKVTIINVRELFKEIRFAFSFKAFEYCHKHYANKYVSNVLYSGRLKDT